MRATAQACSAVENEDPIAPELLSRLYRYTGNALVIGITGPPGAGKSSLLDSLIEEAVAHDYQVGVLAVDPTSPLTGGALLADRLRMGSANHGQVFVRSLATRGSLGGLASASFGILRILEAAGKNLIFVETVGAGQSDIDVAHLALTTLYVTVPNLGDEIQALKAGILELSDIFIVNKSDLGGFELALSQMRALLTFKDHDLLELKKKSGISWTPPILSASALKKQGIAQIFASILSHYEFLRSSGKLFERKRGQIYSEMKTILERRLSQSVNSKIKERTLDLLSSKKSDPYSETEKILKLKR